MDEVMCQIPSGCYQIGTNRNIGFAEDCEGPATTVEVSNFLIDSTTVTNQQFQEFVTATGYVTEAELRGKSLVHAFFLTEQDKKNAQLVPESRWWFVTRGASWRTPEGEGSSLEERWDHPVVQVSRHDALAYCNWRGVRLPSEAEWEIAAKGGTAFELYPWGEQLLQNEEYRCNIWQGEFPNENTKADGFISTAPAKYYQPNGYGCYQMIGNVWEWCSNPARVDLSLFQYVSGQAIWQGYQNRNQREYAIRGGSFLCHESYCNRYRITARNGYSGHLATNHIGFRCVKE